MSIEAPDSARLADAGADWLPAYLHLPFCARLCPYCDFAVVTGRDDQIDRYLEALEAELGQDQSERPLDSIYLGGGTPTRVPAPRLAQLVSSLSSRFGLAPDAEVSLEANPEDWSLDLAEQLAAAGFNRVSFGAQSFDSKTLAGLGRRHQPEAISKAVAEARTAGFQSVNLDLIFGSEDLATWSFTLDQALSLEPDHLSCYALTVEPGTELFRRIQGGETGPDPDHQADQWEMASEKAEAAGLIRYEVSNWARPGHHVRYNLAVWDQGEYLAFGLGAHRFRRGVRSHNFRHLDKYLETVEAETRPWAGSEEIEGWNRELERVYLGLRRVAGVELGAAGEALLAREEGERLLAAGVVERRHQRVVVTRPLLTDAVVRAVLALSPP